MPIALSLFRICVLTLLMLGLTTISSRAQEITASDLGVKDPTILPDSPLYLFKEIGRFFTNTFDFNANPVYRAEKQLRLVSEKLLEAYKLAEKKTVSQELVIAAVKNYEKELEKLKTKMEKLEANIRSERVAKEKDNFLEETLDKLVAHNAILENLDRKIQSPVIAKTIVSNIDAFNLVLEESASDLKIRGKVGEFYAKFTEQSIAKTSPEIKQNLEVLRRNIAVASKPGAKPKEAQVTAEAVKETQTECPTTYRPVCGKDDKTYQNRCSAANAGVPISYRGVCREEAATAVIEPETIEPIASETLPPPPPPPVSREEVIQRIQSVTNRVEEQLRRLETLISL